MSTAMPIQCNTTHRLLARVDEQTMFLWCRTCRTEHPISKEALLRAFEDVRAPECAILPEKHEVVS
jgi:hypothetical protein